ncbi:helix-turn-helix domain-containing protein [Amycolatopsis balhimycina]|uniref:helix-turn-helix domain-containing protein n=1 Tax=Amycolatopsis balhimycina TaxID=208443 RepID=UPI0035E3C219
MAPVGSGSSGFRRRRIAAGVMSAFVATVRTACPVLGSAGGGRRATSPFAIRLVAKRFAETGGDVLATISRRRRDLPPVPSPVTGEVEARLIALACSQPPAGHARWSLRLPEKHVELTEDIPNLDHSTIGRVLKKERANAEFAARLQDRWRRAPAVGAAERRRPERAAPVRCRNVQDAAVRAAVRQGVARDRCRPPPDSRGSRGVLLRTDLPTRWTCPGSWPTH